jgi:hypothetical protein
MTPKTLQLEPFTAGDAWSGIPSIAITEGPEGGPFAPPASDLTTVTMRFQKADGADDVVQLSSATAGQITITNANNWTFAIPAQVVPGLTTGRWNWNIRCTNAAGLPTTYLAGQINVLPSI